MRDALTFYRSFHEAIQEEEDPIKRLQAYEAVIKYALYEEEPEGLKGIAKAAFIVAKPVIDSSNAASDNGKRGGAPKGNQNARKQPKQPPLFLENNPSCNNKTSNDNDNDNENINENENIKPTRKKKEEKHIHGEYKHVRLTEAEFERLGEDLGEETRAAAIKKLDEYIQSSGRKYKDHNLVLRGWVLKALEEDKQRKPKPAAPTAFHNYSCKNNYSLDSLEEILLGGN